MQPTRSGSGYSKPPRLRIARLLAALAALSFLILGASCAKQQGNTNNASNTDKSGKRRTGAMTETFVANIPQEIVLPDESDQVGMRLLKDYGAMFVARGGAVPPPVLIFEDERAVRDWQAGVRTTRAEIGGINVELQSPAMTALMEARTEAQAAKLDITPRGTDAARRSYEDTVKLWQSRVNPGLTHWVNAGRLERDEAARIRQLTPREQIPEILRLEADGLFFSTDFTKSILYSVAAPGTSQHLSMLAFDVKENENAQVRSILARHGWFQTITSDTPHFTFLGVKEDELPSLGLKKATNGGRTFWIPDLS
jgi:hypothetical protein